MNHTLLQLPFGAKAQLYIGGMTIYVAKEKWPLLLKKKLYKAYHKRRVKDTTMDS